MGAHGAQAWHRGWTGWVEGADEVLAAARGPRGTAKARAAAAVAAFLFATSLRFCLRTSATSSAVRFRAAMRCGHLRVPAMRQQESGPRWPARLAGSRPVRAVLRSVSRPVGAAAWRQW
ncbi:hypothetical protein PR002_g6338 [Phytophthora rubi]|uniref:Uncharacterized protein n=1 Tax=Phytophthora rubi TaxID=129364 RepID=A0A6A3N3A3_9STRA|nr:hypothetical protein PR002_g6338 [Phytophthora rubi]